MIFDWLDIGLALSVGFLAGTLASLAAVRRSR